MPRRYSMQRRAEEVDATRRQILDAVVTLVAESGLEALTVQAVAARADVALRTVYNHLGSRDELVAAALGDLAEQTRAAAKAIVVTDHSPRDQVLDFVDAYVRSYEEQGPAVRALMGATAVAGVAEAVEDVRAWRRRQLRSMLRAAQRAGDLVPPLGEAVDVAYLATAHASYTTLVDDVGLSPSSARATLADMVDRALFGPMAEGGEDA